MVNFEYGDGLLVLESDFNITGLQKSHISPAKVKVKKKQNLTHPPLSATNVFRAGMQANYTLENGIHYLEWPGAALFVIHPDLTIQYNSQVDNELLSLLLINEVIGLCLFNSGYSLLHAGSVEIEGKAHIFAGEPGAGKSTLIAALCKYGAKIISDDLCIISQNKEVIYCHTGLQESKLWKASLKGLDLKLGNATPMVNGHEKYYYELPKSSEAKFSLQKIVFLGPQKVPATLAMTQYFPLPNQLLIGDRLKKHFEKSSSIIKAVSSISMKPFTTFEELERWAQKYITNNA